MKFSLKAVSGKIVGGTLGLFLMGGNPFGLLLGLLLGHGYDQLRHLNRLGGHARLLEIKRLFSQQGASRTQGFFLQTLFQSLGKLAKADGRVSETEIAWVESLMRRMFFTPQQRREAIQFFNQGKQAEFELSDTLRQLMRLGKPFGLVDIFLELLMECASCDEQIKPAEWKVIEDISQQLGVHPNYLRHLEARFYTRSTQTEEPAAAPPRRQSSLSQAFKTLGVDESVSKPELKKAYRRLMSRHHPDKLVAKGLPESMMEIAKERTQAIQAAYELICKQRGW